VPRPGRDGEASEFSKMLFGGIQHCWIKHFFDGRFVS
jgi:hypothetical protein